MKNKILLFIPMYNCEKQIVRVLKQLDKEVLDFISQIIIVNNKSTDNSQQAAIDCLKNNPNLPAKVLLNNENYNLGGSHKVAFQYAIKNNFDYVIVLHGDDQGQIQDLLPLLKNKDYQKYDCCLGARFMKGSKLKGYSKLRIFGNYVFNFLFTIVLGKSIKDLGSGLNMYKVDSLKNEYFIHYPDTLYFNDFMLLALNYYRQKFLFFPIFWREEDQVSNNKLISFSFSLIKMLLGYSFNKRKYLEKDRRIKNILNYDYQIMFDNIKENI